MSKLSKKQPVGNRLADIRKQAKMTQEDLANNVGVTRQTIISIEKGKYTPSLPLAFLLAKQFSLKLEDIFKYEE